MTQWEEEGSEPPMGDALAPGGSADNAATAAGAEDRARAWELDFEERHEESNLNYAAAAQSLREGLAAALLERVHEHAARELRTRSRNSKRGKISWRPRRAHACSRSHVG